MKLADGRGERGNRKCLQVVNQIKSGLDGEIDKSGLGMGTVGKKKDFCDVRYLQRKVCINNLVFNFFNFLGCR